MDIFVKQLTNYFASLFENADCYFLRKFINIFQNKFTVF